MQLKALVETFTALNGFNRQRFQPRQESVCACSEHRKLYATRE